MISKTAMLALGKDKAENVRDLFQEADADIRKEVGETIRRIHLDTQVISADDLIGLADTGKRLKVVETSHARLNTLIENYETGGRPPRKIKDVREDVTEAWQDLNGNWHDH